MTDCTKKCIEEINEVSRQLLSRILSTNTDLSSPPQELDVENSEDQSANKESKKETNEIADIMEKRKVLITTLFKQNSAESISYESELIQEMIALDSELTANANLCKQAITEQVIKIKKSKKVTKSYQKY